MARILRARSAGSQPRSVPGATKIGRSGDFDTDHLALLLRARLAARRVIARTPIGKGRP
jgi:hypothetical protein